MQKQCKNLGFHLESLIHQLCKSRGRRADRILAGNLLFLQKLHLWQSFCFQLFTIGRRRTRYESLKFQRYVLINYVSCLDYRYRTFLSNTHDIVYCKKFLQDSKMGLVEMEIYP